MPYAHRWTLVSLLGVFGCGGSSALPSATSDASSDMLPCGALKPLADLPMLGPWKTHRAYYSPDRSWLLLQVRSDDGTEVEPLIRVDLPSGNATTIGSALDFATALGSGGALLFDGTGDSDDVSVFDGKQLRRILGDRCKFFPTPDGTRLFAVGPCVGEENGLEVMDVATGTASIVDQSATMATTWDLAVSPNGQWVAYKTAEDDLDNHTIAVANVTGVTYTIASPQGGYLLRFASDDLLVFQTGGQSYAGDIRGHVPGSGDTSFLIASDRYPGDFPYDGAGYKFSPDATRVLAAGQIPTSSDTSLSGALYSIPLRGGDPLLLVKDWSLQRFTTLFAFDSQGKYALYASYTGRDAYTGMDAYTVSAVDVQGSKPRKLSNGQWFGIAPATSSVLLSDTDDNHRSRLRLTNLDTGLDRLSYTSSNGSIDNATALRGDQAVLFAEFADGDLARFMSVSHPQSVVLGQWDDSNGCEGCSGLRVEADPTGCFTVVNSGLPSNSGTRLVLLPD